jgi:acylphosphatase
MISRRLLISGRVQGVFYRRWTETTARSLGLVGWVRNLGNGNVEIKVSGPDDRVEELIRRCWEGPPAAEVKDIQVEDAEVDAVQGFSARASA